MRGAPEGLQGLGAHPDAPLMLFTQERSDCLSSVLITSLRPWRACEPTGRPLTLEARRPGPDPGGPRVRPFNLSPQPTSLSWGAWPFPGCPRSAPPHSLANPVGWFPPWASVSGDLGLHSPHLLACLGNHVKLGGWGGGSDRAVAVARCWEGGPHLAPPHQPAPQRSCLHGRGRGVLPTAWTHL